MHRPILVRPHSRSTKAGTSAPATPGVRAIRQGLRHQRSTKAGTSAPATRTIVDVQRAGPFVVRSTKAGTSAPATPRTKCRYGPTMPTLKLAQRRPGHQPRRHTGIGWQTYPTLTEHAQRRPGHQPRRHVDSGIVTPLRRARALNEGRDISPGDTRKKDLVARPPLASKSTLNEGRDISPGDTPRTLHRPSWRMLVRSTKAGTSAPATRFNVLPIGSVATARSTKAGTSAPATHAARARPLPSFRGAQRRPGHQPRRHPRAVLILISLPITLNRPGHQPRRHQLDQSPPRSERAQRRPGHQPRRHCNVVPPYQMGLKSGALNEGRDISPGDTPGHSPRLGARHREPLNEGRDISPGDTRVNRCAASHGWIARSTKAGTSAPATPLMLQKGRY